MDPTGRTFPQGHRVLANGTCRRCDRPAEAGPCCSSCAADVMAKAFNRFHGGRRKKLPGQHGKSPPRPAQTSPRPSSQLPCSAPEPSSLLLAHGLHACNCPHLSYGHPPSHLAPSPRRRRDHPLNGAGRRGLPHQAQGHYALSDGRMYWNAGQVLQCVDGASCQPMPVKGGDRPGQPEIPPGNAGSTRRRKTRRTTRGHAHVAITSGTEAPRGDNRATTLPPERGPSRRTRPGRQESPAAN